jgi:hypothetical protein
MDSNASSIILVDSTRLSSVLVLVLGSSCGEDCIVNSTTLCRYDCTRELLIVLGGAILAGFEVILLFGILPSYCYCDNKLKLSLAFCTD